MVRSFDDLISFLLNEIALCGEEGAQPAKFLSYLDAYHNAATQDAHPDANTDNHGQARRAPNVDRPYQEQVWRWLTQHPDVRVLRDGEPCNVTLSQAERSESSSAPDKVKPNAVEPIETRRPVSLPPQSPGAKGYHDPEESSPPIQAPHLREDSASVTNGQVQLQPDVRLFISEERMWHALAGHGPDRQRITNPEFKCLSVITSCREKGILQADLTKATGQDKRSIPKRTQNLYEHGYIEKKPVLFKGTRTSWLYAKQFAPKATSLNISASETKIALSDAPEHDKGAVVDYRLLFNAIFSILRDAKSNLITNFDLVQKLKTWPVKWRSRHRLHILRRLEIIGCIKEVTARAFQEGRLNDRRYRCLKMIREPTEADWKAFLDTPYHGLDNAERQRRAQQAPQDDGQDDDEVDADITQYANRGDENPEGEIQEVERSIPQWTPERPISNFIFDLVHEAGEQGISTKDIQSCGLGAAFKKPIELRLCRLVDHWQISQPLHLRHLAVIRDTALDGKIPHYVHYTYENFRSLVAHGRASWDAVATDSYTSKRKKNLKIPPPEAQADLDEYGFPKISSNAFHGANNEATLADCVHAFKLQPLHFSKGGQLRKGRPKKNEGTASDVYKTTELNDANARKSSTLANNEATSAEAMETFKEPTEQIETATSRVQSAYSGKKKGRPRKVQSIGLPTNFDKLSFEKKHHLIRLQRYGIRYASERAAEAIALLVAEGHDINEAQEFVLAEADAQRERSEETPISSAIRDYLRLPPPPRPYLPSIAAHTTQHLARLKPIDEGESFLAADRSSPWPQEQMDSEYIATPKAKLGRPRKKRAPLNIPYFPSIAAHTFPIWNTSPATHRGTRQQKPRANLASDVYLPSIAAHTFPCYGPGIPAKSNKRKQSPFSPFMPPPKRTKHYTRTSFYKSLSESTPRDCGVGAFLSSKDRDSSRRGYPLSRLAIFKSARLIQYPWFVPGTTGIVDTYYGLLGLPLPQGTPTNSRPVSREASENRHLSNQPQPLMATGLQATSANGEFTSTPRGNPKILRPRSREASEDRHSPDQPQPLMATDLHMISANGDFTSTPREIPEDSRPRSGEVSENRHLPDQPQPLVTTGSHTTSADAESIGREMAEKEQEQNGIPSTPQVKKGNNSTPEATSGTEKTPVTSVPNNSEWTPSSGTQMKGFGATSTVIESEPSAPVEPAGDAQVGFINNSEEHERHAVSESPILMSNSTTTGDHVTNNSQPSGVPETPAGMNDETSLPPLVVDEPNRKALIRQKKMAGGSVAMLRKSIILDLLSKCGGVIPGDKSLEAPFVIEWNKRGQSGGPDKETVRKTVDALCTAGKARKLRFSFRNAKGLTVTKSMVTTSEISATDQKVKDTQRAIISCDPGCYFPYPLEVPADYDKRISAGWRRELEDDDSTVFLYHRPQVLVNDEERRTALDENRRRMKEIRQKERADVEEKQGPEHVQQLVKLLSEGGEKLRKSGVLEERALHETGTVNGHSKLLQDFDAALAALMQAKSNDQPTPPDDGESSIEEQQHLIGQFYAALQALVSADDLNSLGLPRPYFDGSGQASAMNLESPDNGRATHSGHILVEPSKKPRKVQRLASLKEPAFKRVSRRAVLSRPVAGDTGLPREFRFRLSAGLLQPLAISQWELAEKEQLKWVGEEDDAPNAHPSDFMAEPPPWATLDLRTINSGSRGIYAMWNNLQGVTSWPAADLLRDHFVDDVDALLEWEEDNVGHSPAVFPGWPFVNHSLIYAHKFIVTPMVDMEAVLQVKKNPGTTGRMVTRPFFFQMIRPVEGAPDLDRTLRASRQNYDKQYRPIEGTFGILLAGKQSVPTYYSSHINAYTEGIADVEARAKAIADLTARTKGRAETKAGPTKKRTRELSVSAPLKRRRLSRPTERLSLQAEAEIANKISYRGPRKARIFGPENEKRLLVAVIVIRTIAGGLDQRIDWVLVAKIFHPEHDEMFVHSLWPTLRAKNKSHMEKLTSQFQAMFPQAYEEREVPPLDFDHLDEYPWGQLVDWVIKNMEVPAPSTNLELPATRSEFDTCFNLQDSSDFSYAPFFDAGQENTVARREAIQNKQAFVCPIAPKPCSVDKDVATEMDVIKSYARANLLTPVATYNATAAFERLSIFDSTLVSQAVKELTKARILAGQREGRVIPGRNYKISQVMLNNLSKNPSAETLQRAAKFKRHLDRQFQDKNSTIFDNFTSSEQAVVILNLLAHGRIKLRPHNPPMNKFGLLSNDGNISYETRKMDRKSLHFAVEVSITDKYVEGNPLLPVPAAPAPHLELRAGGVQRERRIPFWYDIHDRLVPELWALARSAVISMVTFRPGIRIREIARGLAPGLDLWEVELVLGWLREAKVMEVGGEGWSVREWWWGGLDLGIEADKEDEVKEVMVRDGEGNGRRIEGEEDDVGTSTDDAMVEELMMQGA